MEEIRENKMGTMPVGKLLVSMAAPMIASMLFQALYNIVDSIFVSRVSQDALNAVSLSFPMQMLVIGVSTGTGVGMNALISRYLGEKNKEKADMTANTGIFLFLCSAVFFALLGWLVPKKFFEIQTENPQIIRYGTDYLTVVLGLAAGVLAQMSGERLLMSTGRTNLSMISQITGAAINMVLDPIMIFGLFGFPRMEVRGAAVATVCGQCIAAIVAYTFCITKNKEITLSLRKIRPVGAVIKEIYRIGLPSILMQCMGSIMNFGLNAIFISFTEAATAAFGAYYQIQSFIFFPVFGLNNALTPIVSYNFGAKKPDRVRKAVKIAMIFAISVMTFGLVLFETIPGALLSLFSPTEEMLRVGSTAFRIIAISFPVAGFCIITGAATQALGQPKCLLMTSLCRQLLVLLPVAWLLSLTGKLDLVWLSFLVAEVASLMISMYYLKKTYREALVPLEEPRS